MTSNNTINDALGLPAVPNNNSVAISNILSVINNDSALEDFTLSRSNVRESIIVAAEAVQSLSTLAAQSQSPDDYEVLARLIDTVVNSSEKLLRLQKMIREIEKVDQPHNQEGQQTITNNNLFVGSTAELQEVIEKMKNGQN